MKLTRKCLLMGFLENLKMNKLIFLLICLCLNFNLSLSQDDEYYRKQLLARPEFDTVVLVHLNFTEALQQPEKYKVIEIFLDYYNYDSLKLLTKFENVNTIVFVQTTLQTLPEEFNKFNKIKKLRLIRNDLLDIEQALSVFSENKMIELHITNSNLSNIPFTVHKFRDLKVLDLEYNKIEEITDSLIIFNPNIEVLNLKFNNILYISPKFSQMKKIKELELHNNPLNDNMSIITLDSIFSDLYVQKLGLANCGFKEFPVFIQNMCCLEFITFNGNIIDAFPQYLNLKNFGTCTIWIDMEYAYLIPNKFKHIFCINW